jgi:hypothetical protein
MTVMTEGVAAGHFLVSEGNKTRSRDVVTIKEGEVLVAGQVIQKEESTGKYIAYDATNTDIAEGDGSIGVLWDKTDATDNDVEATAVLRDAEVNGNELAFADDQDTGDREAAEAALRAVGILCRWEDRVS